MKKVLFMSAIVALLSFSPLTSQASENNDRTFNKKRERVELTEEEVMQKKARLEEIRNMDLENLSRKEKRILRKEVKAIENDLSGGVYLSVGAVIVILLILILLT